MILDQAIVESLVLLTNLFNFLLFVVLHLPDLALQFVYLLLFLLGMPSSLLSQVNQLRLAIGLRLLERFDLRLQILDHLGMRVFLLCSSRQHLLHDYLVIRKGFVN